VPRPFHRDRWRSNLHTEMCNVRFFKACPRAPGPWLGGARKRCTEQLIRRTLPPVRRRASAIRSSRPKQNCQKCCSPGCPRYSSRRFPFERPVNVISAASRPEMRNQGPRVFFFGLAVVWRWPVATVDREKAPPNGARVPAGVVRLQSEGVRPMAFVHPSPATRRNNCRRHSGQVLLSPGPRPAPRSVRWLWGGGRPPQT